MANSYYNYQYETSPRKLQPEYKLEKNKKKQTRSSVKTKNNTKVKLMQNHKLNAVKYVAVGFIILFAIGYRNSVINENFNEKENLKSELSAIQKTNEQLEVSIEN